VASTISHKLNQAEINRILTSSTGPVARALLVRGFRVQAQARKNLGGGHSGPKRVDTGLLRASVAVELRRRETLVVRIGTNVEYAIFVHDGTGLYGPKHRRIVPRTKRYLRFRPKGTKRFIYTKSVKGMRPNPFLVDALSAARIGPQR
jgi:phage gpG-like protein